MPETEASVQQPGTVRGADGSRLKQKPVFLRIQAPLACVLRSERRLDLLWFENTRQSSSVPEAPLAFYSLKLSGSPS
jgi:hypothetical protein